MYLIPLMALVAVRSKTVIILLFIPCLFFLPLCFWLVLSCGVVLLSFLVWQTSCRGRVKRIYTFQRFLAVMSVPLPRGAAGGSVGFPCHTHLLVEINEFQVDVQKLFTVKPV